MAKMLVKDLMKKSPEWVDSDATLCEAAAKMRDVGCGVLPVGSKDKCAGMITDRDIVTRALAEEADIKSEKVEDHMTDEVCFCKEEDTLKQAVDTMQKNKVSRLLVKDDEDNIAGIISFGRILRECGDSEELKDIVSGIKGKKAA